MSGLSPSGLCDSDALAHAWHAVAVSDEVAPGPVAVRLLGSSYVVWRGPDGVLVAAPDRCPHREAPLSIGRVEAGALTCGYHGWRFGTGGRCVLVPSSGPGSAVPPAAHLAPVLVTERYGLVWMHPAPVDSDPTSATAAIPTVDEDDDPSYRRLNTEMQLWRTSVGRMVDNFLDYSHFPWVHRASFGAATDPEIERITLGQMGDFVGYSYAVEAANPEAASAASGSRAASVARSMTTGFALPFAVRSTITYESGLRHVLLLCSAPIDEATSYFTFVVWRNDGGATPAEEILAFDRQIADEDRTILERVPGALPLGPTALVNVQSDRPSVEWRRRLRLMICPDR